MSKETITIYVAQFEYGQASLYRLEAIETDKMYKFVKGSRLDIIDGYYSNLQIQKNDTNPRPFANQEDAVTWLSEKAKAYHEALLRSVEASAKQIEMLQNFPK